MNEDFRKLIMSKLIEVVCNSEYVSWREKGSTIVNIYNDIINSIH